MTIVHAGDQLAATNSQVTFAVDASQVSLDVRLADAQLDPSQPFEATLVATCADPLPPSGDLTLLTLATTDDTNKAWTFSMAHNITIQRSGRFVPQTSGVAILRTSVLDTIGYPSVKEALVIAVFYVRHVKLPNPATKQ